MPFLSFKEIIVSAVQNDSSKLAIAANKGKSFQCSESLGIALNSKESVTVTVNKIKVQPFGGSFGEGKNAQVVLARKLLNIIIRGSRRSPHCLSMLVLCAVHIWKLELGFLEGGKHYITQRKTIRAS